MDDGSNNWLAKLRELEPTGVFVHHNPPTPRYGRAETKLAYLVREGIYLGHRPDESAREGAIEIALWCAAPHGRGHGYYACFRLFTRDDQPEVAILFCFYDGTERSPGFKSAEAAGVYAQEQGFRKDDHEDV